MPNSKKEHENRSDAVEQRRFHTPGARLSIEVPLKERDDAASRVSRRALVVSHAGDFAHQDEQERDLGALMIVQERMPGLGILLHVVLYTGVGQCAVQSL